MSESDKPHFDQLAAFAFDFPSQPDALNLL
jgi:hypothetical protein